MMIKTFTKLGILLLVLSASAAAQNIVDTSPTISANGKAEIFVVPDFVSFRLDVTKENLSLEVAKRETDKVTDKIRKITDQYGLKNDDVSVTYISVAQKFRYVQNKDNKILDEDGDEVGQKEFVGYEATTYISITVKDLSKFQPLFEELLATGVTEIDKVDFQTTKLREVKDKARDMAMKAAKEKATAMAGAIGQTVGKAIKITEGSNRSSYSSSNISSNNNFSFDGANPSGVSSVTSSYSPGVISVDAEVSVTFLLN